MVAERDAALRAAVFARLEKLVAASPDGTVRSAEVNALVFEDRPFQVIGQQGIRKVAGLEAALAFTTVYRAPGRARPYDDAIGDEGLVRPSGELSGGHGDPKVPQSAPRGGGVMRLSCSRRCCRRTRRRSRIRRGAS